LPCQKERDVVGKTRRRGSSIGHGGGGSNGKKREKNGKSEGKVGGIIPSQSKRQEKPMIDRA